VASHKKIALLAAHETQRGSNKTAAGNTVDQPRE
jgi:hypothetical protein